MKTILIATERDLEQNLLAQTLSSEDYAILRCKDGVEALELLRTNAPSILLVNVTLPKMDGFALYRRCQQDERLRQLPFVLFSARSKDEKSERFARELGAPWFVADALRTPALLATLAEAASTQRTAMLPILKTGAGPAVSMPPPSSQVEPAQITLPIVAFTDEAMTEARQAEQLKQQADMLQQLRDEASRQAFTLSSVQAQLAAKTDEASEFGRLFNSSPVAMWLTDKQTQRIVAVNDAMTRLFGYARSELEQMDCKVLLQDSQASSSTQILGFRHKDGRGLSLLLNVTDVDFHGHPAEMTAAQDVSYRVRGERALADEVLRLKSLLAALPVAWCLCDAEGVLRDLNDAACALLRDSRAQLLQRSLPELLSLPWATVHALPPGERHTAVRDAAAGAHLHLTRGLSPTSAELWLFLLTEEVIAAPEPIEPPQPPALRAAVLPAMLEVMRYAADADENTLLQYAVARVAHAFDSPVTILAAVENITQTMETLAMTPHRQGAATRLPAPEAWRALLQARTGELTDAHSGLLVEGWPEIDNYQVCAVRGAAHEQWLLLTANRAPGYSGDDQADLLLCAELLAMQLAQKRKLQLAVTAQQRQGNLVSDALALLQKTLDQQQSHAVAMSQLKQGATRLYEQQKAAAG